MDRDITKTVVRTLIIGASATLLFAPPALADDDAFGRDNDDSDRVSQERPFKSGKAGSGSGFAAPKVKKTEVRDGVIYLTIESSSGEEKTVTLDSEGRCVSDSKKIPLERAKELALEKVAGEIIEVEYEKGRYEVKIRTTDGKKREVYVNPKTGEVRVKR